MVLCSINHNIVLVLNYMGFGHSLVFRCRASGLAFVLVSMCIGLVMGLDRMGISLFLGSNNMAICFISINIGISLVLVSDAMGLLLSGSQFVHPFVLP